jgi:threonine/homoserine/homoserine lactone efflux protein
MASGAFANGRFPSAQTIAFRTGNPSDVVVGATFGPLISHDGGTTWRWMCEAAVGYGGTYDPDYAYATSGAIFATTFDGLHVNRDGCTYDATAIGPLFVSQTEVAHWWGMLGAACAVSGTVVLTSLVLSRVVVQRLGIQPTIMALFRDQPTAA